MKNVSQYKLNWRPDLPDERDIYKLTDVDSPPPSFISLESFLPPVYDQGRAGSCTANAACAAYIFDLLKEGTNFDIELSRLFLYYNTREMEGSADHDGGATIRDTIKSLASLGVSKEEMWPYIVSEVTTRPPKTAYIEAEAHKAIEYAKVNPNLDFIKAALYEGNPLVFGFSVYENFHKTGVTGVMELPSRRERVIGGHAVMAYGYDDLRGVLFIRNSWGIDWGDGGNFLMPYAFVNSRQTSDYWQIKAVTP